MHDIGFLPINQYADIFQIFLVDTDILPLVS